MKHFLLSCLFFYTLTQVAQTVNYQTLYTQSSFDNKTIDPSKAIGVIAGSPSVSANGNAAYTIPIFTPEGINGMQPSISVSYNSSAGNGLLGYGWSLNASSAITYDNKDLYHDNILSPAYINGASPFILDGQRLVAISGNNGNSGTTYRTEQESFNQIISTGNLGACSTCPEYFTVTAKNGVVSEYGKVSNNNNSRLMNNTNTLPIVWYLNKVQDQYGNYIEYKYKLQNGEHLLDEIIYTKNNANSGLPLHSIKFEYATRTDFNTYYYQSTTATATPIYKRNVLTNILVKAEDFISTRQYTFNYAYNGLYTYLNDVKEQAYPLTTGSSEELNSTIFLYGVNQTDGIQSSTCAITQNTTSELLHGDFNGDNYDDLVALEYQTDTKGKKYSQLKLYLNNKTNNPYSNAPITEALPATYNTYTVYAKPLIADTDGDGRDEVVVGLRVFNTANNKMEHHKYQRYFMSTTNTLLETSTTGNTIIAVAIEDYIATGDFDGDAKSDLIIYSKYYTNGAPVDLYFYNLGSNLGTNYWFTTSYHPYLTGIKGIDINGDTKDEICIFFGDAAVVLSLDGSVLTGFSGELSMHTSFGDFNGDGLTDNIYVCPEMQQVTLNKYMGNGNTEEQIYTNFFTEGINTTQFYNKTERVFTDDMNNDGKDDIIHYYLPAGSTTPKYAIYYSNGVNFSRKEFTATHNQNWVPQFTLDVNADGLPELLDTIANTTQPFYISTISNTYNNNNAMLAAIKDGHGSTTKFNYQLLSQPNSIYTYSPSSTYPLRNINPKSWAVGTLTNPNGSGNLNNTTTTSYYYENALIDAVYGYLGFSKVKTIDNLTTLVQETYNTLIDPTKLIMLPTLTKSYYSTNPSNILSQTEPTYKICNLGGFRYWLYDSQVVVTQPNGATTTSYANYNNTTGNITATATVNDAIITIATYTNYTNNGSWMPHLPQTIVTTKAYNGNGGFNPATFTYTGSDHYSTTTQNTYNNKGQLTEQIQFYGSGVKELKTNYTYNATYGWLSQQSSTIQEPSTQTRTQSYEYFPNQRTLKKIFNSSGQCLAEVLTYDPRYNSPIRSKDIKGVISSTTTDAFGNPIKDSIIYPTSGVIPQTTQTSTTTYYWDIALGNNQLVRTQTTITPYNTISNIYTDFLGRTIKTESNATFDGTTITATQTYNDMGRLATQTGYDAENNPLTTTYTYYGSNQHYRLQQVSNTLNTLSYTYTDGNGLSKTKVLQVGSGAFKEQTTDAAGFLIKSEDNGGTITYQYNSQGNLTQTLVQGVVANTMEYDAITGMQTKLDAKSSIKNYKYNSWGELLEETDNQAQPNKYKMEYDGLGRIKKRWLDPSGELTEYIYNTTGNGINQLSQITINGQPDQTFTYDGRHRVATQTQYILDNNNLLEPYTTSYQYRDEDNQLKQITYPQGLSITYSYTTSGFLDSVKNGTTLLYKTRATNYNGQLKEYLTGNGAITEINYLPNGMPRRFYATKSGTILQNLEMSFDNYGNLSSRKDNHPSIKQEETFIYNTALDQLKTITTKNNIPTTPISITKEINYATNGNIINKYDAGITTTPTEAMYQYSNLHALTTLNEKCTTPDANIPYKVQHLTLPQQIKYTKFNQPDSISENGSSLKLYYNSNYQRIKTIRKSGTNTQNTRYYVGNYEKDVTGTTIKHIYYIYGGNGLCAIIVKNGSTTTTYTAYTDHLGSLVTLINNASPTTITARQSFDAWGRYRNPANWNDYTSTGTANLGGSILGTGASAYLRRGYTMHEHYKEFGLINMNGRLYDPIVGRMLSPDAYVQDPTNTQNYNRYTYVLNNPLKYTDPTGWRRNHRPLKEKEEKTGYGPAQVFNPSVWVMIQQAWNTATNSGYNYASFSYTNGVMTSANYGTFSSGNIGANSVFISYYTSYNNPNALEDGEFAGEVTADIITFNKNNNLSSTANSGGVGWIDNVQTGLDVAGIADPTGIVDGVNALIYAGRGQWGNAGISALGIIPYIGDAGKATRLGSKTLNYLKMADKTHGTAATFNKTSSIHSKIMFNDITQGFSKQVINTPKGPIIRANLGDGNFIQMRNFDRSGSHTTFDFINSNGLFYEFKFNR